MKRHAWFKGKVFLIELILTNKNFSLKDTQSFETGLSGHHHMVYTMLKTTFKKFEPKQLIYIDFKNFYFQSFKNDLLKNMFTCARSYNVFDKKKFATVFTK